MEDKQSYQYWRENIMDERLAYLDAGEKYELYLQWRTEKEETNANSKEG